MYRPVLSAAPTSAIVTLQDAKNHLRVDSTDEDSLIQTLVDAATAYLDGFYGVLGRAMVTQTWIQKFDGWDSYLYLPVFPVASITSVVYLNSSGGSTTVTASDYQLLTDECGPYVAFDQAFSYPTLGIETGPQVTVTYVAGEAVTNVPRPLKQAMLLLIGHWFAQRETVNVGNITTELEFTVRTLIAPYRRVHF